MVTVDESVQQEKCKAEELKNIGNKEFATGEYKKAIETYTEAISYCSPEHDQENWSKIYSNIAACYMKLEEYKNAVEATNEALKVDVFREKPLLRRGESFLQLKKFPEALADFNELLDKFPNLAPETAENVKRKIDKCKHDSVESDEKLKEEMLAKLKDLGNMVLRPFGLDTSCFQVNDDGHGGKTISMKQPNM